MYRPVLFTLIAVCLYAAQNVIIERRLSTVSPLVMMVYYYGTLLPIVVAVLCLNRPLGLVVTTRTWSMVPFIAVAALLVFAADYCFFSAYHSGGSLQVISTIVALLPVVGSAMKFATGGGAPGPLQLAGMACAVLAVVLVSWPSPVKP